MNKLKQNKEQKRDAILKAAQEIFLTNGYIQTSMDQIADKAQVTKQTVYRYFSSKEILFESTLRTLREKPDRHFADQLNKPDTQEALVGFAIGFIQAHLSKEHLATVRLLISENAKAPELTRRFFLIGPNETGQKLDTFFKDRFDMKETSHPIRMWTGMLLAIRTGVLMGLEPPTKNEIEEYAEKTTAFFMKSLSADRQTPPHI
jgi:AcrR family transcriptional regulator